jgi:hypothetical protein
MIIATIGNQRCAQIGMRETVPYRVPAHDANERFDIHRNLTEAEDHQAEVTSGDALDREPGTHVERREWH